MLSECIKTDDYLTKYAPYLGAKSVETDKPLYTPGVDESLDFSSLYRAPKPAQANAVNALVRAWELQRALILCGEMGTGKTWMGAAACHMHAAGKPYRAVIMAPNHLIDKWQEEIEITLPGVTVRTFEKSRPSGYDDSYQEVLAYADYCRGGRLSQVKGSRTRELAKWTVPARSEWVIVGRNQAKHEPKWEPMGMTKWVRNPGCFRTKILTTKVEGQPDRKYRSPRMTCPKCGQPIATPDGNIIDPRKAENQMHCQTKYLVEVDSEGRQGTGLDVLCPLPEIGISKNAEEGREVRYLDRNYKLMVCGEPLWTWTPKPRKWAPAKIIQNKMDGLFDYFLLDEMHEEKSATSAQALAASKIMGSARRIMGLTGTLIGGYATTCSRSSCGWPRGR